MKGHALSRPSAQARLQAIAVVAVALFTLSVQGAWAAAPVNDNYADATPISALPFSASVDLTNATIEPGEPTTCSVWETSAWYTFTPSVDEQIAVSHNEGGFLGAARATTTGRSSGSGARPLPWARCTTRR